VCGNDASRAALCCARGGGYVVFVVGFAARALISLRAPTLSRQSERSLQTRAYGRSRITGDAHANALAARGHATVFASACAPAWSRSSPVRASITCVWRYSSRQRYSCKIVFENCNLY